MYLSDYHIHTRFSPDSKATIMEMAETAYKRGFQEIIFTDHYEAVKDKSLDLRLDIINEAKQVEQAKNILKGKIKIKLGIELGQPHFDPETCSLILKSYPFDFVIGSVHNIVKDYDLYHYDYNKIDHVEVFEFYMKELLTMAKESDFDVMGHLTYPLRYMWAQARKTIDLKSYEQQWRELLEILIERGKGIEVNTSGLRQSIGQFLPPIYLVKLYKELGGKIITLGSDAHRPSDITCGIIDGIAMIKEAGFDEITRFEGRIPSFFKIN